MWGRGRRQAGRRAGPVTARYRSLAARSQPQLLENSGLVTQEAEEALRKEPVSVRHTSVTAAIL